jgi:hypothetical protein
MAFQPDFILQYAHYLHEYYEQQGFNNPEVYVELRSTKWKIKSKYIDTKINLKKKMKISNTKRGYCLQ